MYKIIYRFNPEPRWAKNFSIIFSSRNLFHTKQEEYAETCLTFLEQISHVSSYDHDIVRLRKLRRYHRITTNEPVHFK